MGYGGDLVELPLIALLGQRERKSRAVEAATGERGVRCGSVALDDHVLDVDRVGIVTGVGGVRLAGLDRGLALW